MKVLVALNHPAHYYLFKYTAQLLIAKGYQVKYVIRDKDVLEQLLICEKVDYIKINETRTGKSNKYRVIFRKLSDVLIQDVRLNKIVTKWKPDLMMGTDIAITHIGKLRKIPSLVFNEDDYEINKHFCIFSYPFATKIISPNVCSVGIYENKRIGYNGYQKMAYLNPKFFQPSRDQVKDIVGDIKDFFIIRLVSLSAGHDVMAKSTGLNELIIDELITELAEKGRIFISSEEKINSKYDKFKLELSPNKIHHLLAYASLVIGDSQTMCIEAGLLGTPFIRFNDFVGKISVLNEIENSYGLGYGIQTNKPEMVLEKTREILSIPDYKKLWQARRDKLFDEKIDVTGFFTQVVIEQLNKSR